MPIQRNITVTRTGQRKNQSASIPSAPRSEWNTSELVANEAPYKVHVIIFSRDLCRGDNQ